MTIQEHPGDCPGRHTKGEVGVGLVAVRCSHTRATYWYKRCTAPDEATGAQCRNYTNGRPVCFKHRHASRED